MEQAVATGAPSTFDKTGLCLLSLDGGGVRGLSTLYILKHLMNRLNQERPDRGPLKPCEVFDLIGGTSTGGLIAIMLGRLEMSVDDCIETYIKLISTIFEKKSRWPVNLSGNIRSRFDATKLESAIKEVVTSHGAKEMDLFNDGAKRGCRVFVCTTSHETKDIVRLRDYSVTTKDDIPATICQAALATSAATTFFKPVYIGTQKFVDGALGSNNPVDEVEGEAADIWCPGTGDLKPLVKCFVSIGTGDPGIAAIEDRALKFLSETLVAIATETDRTEKKFIARWAKHFDEKRYFRFNVEQGLQEVGLEEYREQGKIQAVTHRYLDHQAQAFRVRDCVQNLKLKESMAALDISNKLNELDIHSIMKTDRPLKAKGPWVVPFQRNQLFVGRKPEISKVDEMLSSEDRCERVAIVGLGGVGKTQIALEYVHSVRERHPDCAVFWIPVTNAESMLEAYLEIGRKLHIPNLEKEQANVRRLVLERLNQESSGKWLLVFDNTDDITIWTDEAGSSRQDTFLPRSRHGSILFTSRSHKTAFELAGRNVVTVKELGSAQAKDLLEKLLIDQELLEDGKAMMDLLQKLTHLPLAIVQAAAYINKNQITLSEYISLLDDTEQSMIDILSQDFDDEGRYQSRKNPIATTWLISFEQIRTSDQIAADYLSFISCLDSKNVPQSLLPPAQSTVQTVNALGTLKAFSFIIKHKEGELFDVHRLVHLATRNWLFKEGSMAYWKVKVLDRLHEVFPDGVTYQASWKLYVPHARYALESETGEYAELKKANLFGKFGYWLCQYGRYKEAESAFTVSLRTHQRLLPADHPHTLAYQRMFLPLYIRQGRWDEAEELGKKLLESQREAIGKENLDTLIDMATLYTYMNSWKNAEEFATRVMESIVRDGEGQHTLLANNILAKAYVEQGHGRMAIEIGVPTLEGYKKTYGLEHPYTNGSIGTLATVYRRLGNLEEAERLGRQALEGYRKTLGEEHRDTVTCMFLLGVIYRDKGQWKEAEKVLEQVVNDYKRLFGTDHPETLVAVVYLKGGKSLWRRESFYPDKHSLSCLSTCGPEPLEGR
ncbi:hypothetical protein BDV23DRAFT_16028 [Aspergillus alliaceus]|uniref:PNPLA domain-containing protein n=1 Tax=Petromyces alliaceus TaxID=209559 RepID=A0A5N7BUZ7_PETAA|nr:hypothetical protein BDV23DRAFT_16028 [Aspergillus alliaceus]